MSAFFPEVSQPIAFDGPDSKNPLAFKFYRPDRMVGDRTMAQHLRFAVAYWHTFCAAGRDIFGDPVFIRPWDDGATEMDKAQKKARAAFEFFTKLGVDYYCFHDRDLAPEGKTTAESIANLEKMVKLAARLQKETGVKLLWGTANLFGHPRYTHGAATNPDPAVFAQAAVQVKNAIAATKELGGENYVFWGGREGYETLLNTDMKRELDQMAKFLHLAVDYAKSIGFEGQFLIEPKPKEPTKHQYDFDVASVLGFLKAYDLDDYFKINIEANHATLAGHTFDHDLTLASINGKLGSVDANTGDLLLGWDTDQFPTDPLLTAKCMLVVLRQGGLGSGGLNFDAKVRRGSVDTIDLFHAHIGGMDAFARGLLMAQRIIEDGVVDDFISQRYAGYDSGLGRRIMTGEEDFASLEKWALANGEPEQRSGRQEYLENILMSYL